MRFFSFVSKAFLFALLPASVLLKAADTPTVTVKGYVLDSACAFTKGLSKPISKQCAISCAKMRVLRSLFSPTTGPSTGPLRTQLRPAVRILSFCLSPATK